MMSNTLKAALVGCLATALVLGTGTAAPADNASNSSTMAPTYRIEARIWKNPGNPNPTRWATSAWTYHGAALQSMTRIRNTATIQSWGGSFTFSCTVGVTGTEPTGNCTGNGSVVTDNQTLWWENGNIYESDINGVVYPNFGVYWLKICSAASAYSRPLGIHGYTQACVG